jgi:uncharacterized coiled-coil DUF342 family protein
VVARLQVKRLQLVDETYQSDRAKLQEIRQLAAKKNREIAMVQRKIDEIPSRTELQQYQRQFVELYEQVSSKFTETRKYYNSYNTLNDTRQFLQKEVRFIPLFLASCFFFFCIIVIMSNTSCAVGCVRCVRCACAI